MASSTAPVMPLPLAMKELADGSDSGHNDTEKDAGIGHPVTAANSGPNTIYIDPAAERRLVRKQVRLSLQCKFWSLHEADLFVHDCRI